MANEESIKFTKKTLDDILVFMKTGWKSNAEIGVKLCGDEKDIQLGPLCFGEVCAVDIRNCGDKPLVGSLHTHPHSQPFLNDGDVMSGAVAGEKVMCICGNTKAPGIALDLEKPQPFEDLACRCAKIDSDKEAYHKIHEIFDNHKDAIVSEVEKIKEENKELERGGLGWRLREHPMATRAHRKMMEEAQPYIKKVLKKAKYQTFPVKE